MNFEYIYRQDQINQNYQEFLKEKTKIDEIIAKVKEEQRNKTIENMVKKQVAQEEIQEFIESQKIFVIKDQERVLRENEAIKAFIAKKEAWTEEQNKIQAVLKVKKHEFVQSLGMYTQYTHLKIFFIFKEIDSNGFSYILKRKIIIFPSISQKLTYIQSRTIFVFTVLISVSGEKLEAERINEREKESLLHELNEGRQRERDRIQERLELEQEIRKRLNFKQANEIALEYREKIRAKLKNEDEEWKRKIMEEAEKAAKLDQMGNQKRRMKMLELRRDADRLLAERQKIREIEKKEEKLFWLEQQEAERQKQMIIEEERQKLLREHAHKLIGFLPTEILNEEDLERLGREDVRFLYKPDKAVSPMTVLEQKFAPNTNY